MALGIMWRTVWSVGTQCPSPPVMVMIAAEKPPVATDESSIGIVGSTVVTVESLLTEVL